MFPKSKLNIKTFKNVCVQKGVINCFSFFIAEYQTQDLKHVPKHFRAKLQCQSLDVLKTGSSSLIAKGGQECTILSRLASDLLFSCLYFSIPDTAGVVPLSLAGASF